jgi:hypothetical protein
MTNDTVPPVPGQVRADSLDGAALDERLIDVRDGLVRWLRCRQVDAGGKFGRFSLCAHALAEFELNAATTGIELWAMLGLELTEQDRAEAVEHLRGYQTSTGLVVDPSWRPRHQTAPIERLDRGDPFFTMTTYWALRSLGSGLARPVAELAGRSGAELMARLRPLSGAHGAFAIGDWAALVESNRSLGVPGADEQGEALRTGIGRLQDPVTGLWEPGGGEVKPPFTPAVNLAFHVLRSIHNVARIRPPHIDRMIDTCLAAADDVTHYGWGRGLACNDLDLALVLHTASCWSPHRRGEVAVWARERLPLILALHKQDGGFSFHHTHAMTEHGGYAMSPGAVESDGWGSLMYANTIKMMVELGYEGVTAPWRFGSVHHVARPTAGHIA